MIHEVEAPGGRVLKIEGPEDATDEELIGIAKQHLSASKSAKPAAPSPAPEMKSADLPSLSSPNQLLNEAKQGTPELKANIPGAYESTQGTNALPTASSMYDLLSQGDIKGAYNSLPQNVRDVTEIGAPIGAAILAGKAGYDLYKSNKESGQGGQGIKARTIGAETAPAAQPQPTSSAQPTEPTFNPKEAKIAKDIENKYGFSWKDIKNNFGVSDVTITNPQEAEMLAGAYQQKQQAPVAQPTTPVETAPAPVAEAPKAAAVPPAEVPKAPVEPEKLTKEQKGMKNYLVAQYGGGPEGEAAYGKVKEILGTTPEFPKGQGGGLTSEQTKIIKDWRKANIEGPKVNLTHDMKKALKGGAGLAVLAAIPGFADAAQRGDYGKMTDIATDFLVLPFAQSREVGEGEQQELAKRRYEGMVGAGRGITPAQAYNVGAGRGIAPPSAYQR
jgi:hypothetical protein